MYHKINHFTLNNSLAFSAFTVVSDHHHYLVLEHSYHPKYPDE